MYLYVCVFKEYIHIHVHIFMRNIHKHIFDSQYNYKFKYMVLRTFDYFFFCFLLATPYILNIKVIITINSIRTNKRYQQCKKKQLSEKLRYI